MLSSLRADRILWRQRWNRWFHTAVNSKIDEAVESQGIPFLPSEIRTVVNIFLQYGISDDDEYDTLDDCWHHNLYFLLFIFNPSAASLSVQSYYRATNSSVLLTQVLLETDELKITFASKSWGDVLRDGCQYCSSAILSLSVTLNTSVWAAADAMICLWNATQPLVGYLKMIFCKNLYRLMYIMTSLKNTDTNPICCFTSEALVRPYNQASLFEGYEFLEKIAKPLNSIVIQRLDLDN